MARKVRYTIYDMMEDKGIFDENPNNAQSPKYKGPAKYPRMVYHPEGAEKVVQKAEILKQPWGVERVGEQKELISKVVENEEEFEQALHDGWHDHPAKSIAARPGIDPALVPRIGGAEQISALEDQIRQLQAQLAESRQMHGKTKAA